MIRALDILLCIVALVLFSPVLLIAALLIKLTSKGTVFFVQKRVGKNGVDFNLYKFRTMSNGKGHHITVGARDSRITVVGYYLRKFKIDELPQLFNVIKGEMSIVGPRPELRRYVEMYSEEQRKALTVLPGITDYASIAYRNENALLANAKDPEQFYINNIIPHKLELNKLYINNRGIRQYFRIIAKTFVTSVRGK